MTSRRVFTIIRNIHKANSYLHQKHMRGAADVAIFEGKESIEFLKYISPHNQFPPHYLSNDSCKRWIQVVLKNDKYIDMKLQSILYPKSKITLVKYAGYGQFKYQTIEEARKNNFKSDSDICIPEINIVTANIPQPDYIREIDLDTLETDSHGEDVLWDDFFIRRILSESLSC